MSDHAWNRCDICGRFISMHSLNTGEATRRCVSVDSEFSHEDYETLCKLHAKRDLLLTAESKGV